MNNVDMPQLMQNLQTWAGEHALQTAAIIIIALVLLKVIGLIVDRLEKAIGKTLAEAEYEPQTRAIALIIRWALRLGVIGVAVTLLLREAGVNVQPLTAAIGEWLLGRGLHILLVIIITIILLKVIGVATTRVQALLAKTSSDPEYEKRAKTLSGVIRWVLRVAVMVIAFMMLLENFGVDIGPVIAAAGVVGLAVGFGAQNLVQDFIGGFFILLEDQIRVGDVVQIGDKGGLVERINLRRVILRDLAGNVHFIRNGTIDVVTNMTKEYSRYVFDVGVAYREDIDEVIAALKSIDEELRQDPEFGRDILQPLEVLGLDSFGDSAIIVKARITTKPIQQWRIGREFNRRMKRKFDELNIEIPFPHQTIYFGKDKAGAAPPLNVEMAQGAEPPRHT